MPKSPGPAFRAVSAVATGSTSLTITKPTGTADLDIMLMFLTHKGAGYATMPAGWTVIEQNIQGATRGELHWKRASSEGANYAVADLADTAVGFIVSYPGCKTTGSPIDVSTSRANAIGANGVASLTATIANSLLVLSAHMSNASNASGFGNQGGGAAARPRDQDLASLATLQSGTTATGTDCGVWSAHAMKVIPGATAQLGWTQIAVENVGIAAVLLPDTTTSTAGTRYYLAQKPGGVYVLGPLAGEWASGASGPTASAAPNQLTYRFDQVKANLGPLAYNVRFTTNQQGDYDTLIGRWMTPPLEAQTISGTFDLMFARAAYFENGGASNSSVVRYKVHVYITVGQTADVRATLLDQYADSVDFPYLVSACAGLASAQTLATVACEAGDSLMVEVGFRVVSSPTPTPTYPPTAYTVTTMAPFGGANVSTGGVANVPYALDKTNGSTETFSVPFVEFSGTLVEQAAGVPPANDACATAIELALPYESPARIDTTQSTYSCRSVWYRYTADEDATLIFALYGSNYFGTFEFYEGACGSLDIMSTVFDANRMQDNRCQTTAMIDVTAGTDYFIRVLNRAASPGGQTGGASVSGGGSLRLLVSKRDMVPQVDDIYIPAINLAVWRDGVIVNLTPDFASSAPTGIALDYSRTPMDDLNGGTNETDRVYLALHNADVVEIINLNTFNLGEFEIDYIIDPISDIEQIATLQIDPDQNLVLGSFGNGYLYVTGASAGLSAYLNDISSPSERSYVRRLPAIDADNQAGAPFPSAEAFIADDGPSSANHVALSPDGSVLYYTTGAWYLGSSAQTIKRFNLTANTQMADFATVAASSSPFSGLRGLCVLPDDSVLVCNGSQLVWLTSEGVVQQTYAPAESDEALMLADVRVTADGTSCWVIDGISTSAWKFDVLSAVQEDYLQTFMANGSFSQFALYQPDGITPNAIVPRNTTADVREIRWLRIGPRLEDERGAFIVDRFELECQVGVGTLEGDDVEPPLYLSWSDNAGNTWSNEYSRSMGRLGNYTQFLRWNRLGATRGRNFMVSGSARVKIALIDAYLKLRKGTS